MTAKPCHIISRMKDFIGQDAPPYVILSHAWGPTEDEVTYQDFQNRENAKQKPGFSKIDNCCSQARRDGYEWVWIDSICIGKTSSAELTEAINSMYKWYKESHMCYAYLSDVFASPALVWALQSSVSFESRWLSRGWTLKELTAPQTVVFFNARWEDIGTKVLFAETLRVKTGIPI